jgi:hypothetical protein
MEDRAHAKANWKNHSWYAVSFMRKKLVCPMNVFLSTVASSPPYAKAYPVAQKARPPPQESKRFHKITFLTFFARIDPAQSIAKPVCIKYTRAPYKKKHAEFLLD